MLPSQPHFLCILCALGGLLSGCTITPPAPEHIEAPSHETAPQADQEFVPVTRYGRYTLVELVSPPAQRDLMEQVVEVAVPPAFDASVGDALRQVLLRSGYRLCDTPNAAALYALPLPAAHLHLGPLVLRDALLTLAGPAWNLSVDDSARQVCFEHHAASSPPVDTKPSTDQAEAAEDREARP